MELTDEEYKLAVDMMKAMMKNGAGAILGGIFCIFGIITTTTELFLDKIYSALDKNKQQPEQLQ